MENNNYKNGYGEYKYLNGDIYKGYWKDDKSMEKASINI